MKAIILSNNQYSPREEKKRARKCHAQGREKRIEGAEDSLEVLAGNLEIKLFRSLGFGPLELLSWVPCRGQIKRRVLLRRPACSNMSVV